MACRLFFELRSGFAQRQLLPHRGKPSLVAAVAVRHQAHEDAHGEEEQEGNHIGDAGDADLADGREDPDSGQERRAIQCTPNVGWNKIQAPAYTHLCDPK